MYVTRGLILGRLSLVLGPATGGNGSSTATAVSAEGWMANTDLSSRGV